MRQFLLAYLVFFAAHMLPASPPLRRRLVALLGERVYLLSYSALSVALAGWLVLAALQAPYFELWSPPPVLRHIALLLAPLGVVLVMVGLLSANPLSVTLNRGAGDTRFGAVTRLTRHPVLWGFGLWALAHLLVNGDLVMVLLFGGLAVFASLGMWLLDTRKRRQIGAANWRRLAASAPLLGWRGTGEGMDRPRLDAGLLAGLVSAIGLVAWLVLGGHASLVGVPIGV